jgi:serine/threonine-protein kinase RsbW
VALTDAAISGDPPPALDDTARRTVFVLPADGQAVGEARHLVLKQLRTWGMSPDECDTAALIMSELFTNAVIHTNSETIRCNLGVTRDQMLLIQVTDDGSGVSVPRPQRADPKAEGGRGLMLVKALSANWGVGVMEDVDAQVVWATVRPVQA